MVGDMNHSKFRLGLKDRDIAERVDVAHTGLGELDVPFTDRIIDSRDIIKRPLKTDDIAFFDEFIIGSSVTGFQQIICLGIRIRANGMREPGLKVDSVDLLTEETDRGLVQGIYAMSVPKGRSRPQIQKSSEK